MDALLVARFYWRFLLSLLRFFMPFYYYGGFLAIMNMLGEQKGSFRWVQSFSTCCVHCMWSKVLFAEVVYTVTVMAAKDHCTLRATSDFC